MGLFFLGNEREDFIAMVEEITQRVEDLGLGNAQGLGDVEDRFALLMERDHVPDGHAQSINHRLAAADAFQPDDVRVFGLNRFGHVDLSEMNHHDPRPV
jgi:hypothetical protein